MGKWIYKMNFKDIWEAYDNDEMEFSEFLTKFVQKLKYHYEELQSKNIVDDDELDSLSAIVDEFEYSVEYENEFDNIFTDLYDWADYNRVWIATQL